MRTLRSGLLTLAPVLVGVLIVVMLLGGCGGSGGTPSDSVVVDFREASRAVTNIPMATRLAGMNFFSSSRSRQYDTCPRYIASGNSVTMDFGSGCYSPEFGKRIWGKITATVVNPRYDSDSDLIDFERINISLSNLGSAEEGTYNGTISFHNIGRDDALGYDFDVRLQRQCEERLTFKGVATYREGWFDAYVVMNGEGQYTAPAAGTIRFSMNDLTYTVYGGCDDYPTAGAITMSAGGTTATAYFDTGSCGYARIVVGGSSQVIDLTNIDFDPCSK